MRDGDLHEGLPGLRRGRGLGAGGRGMIGFGFGVGEEAAEVLQGTEVVALRGIDAALETGEDFGAAVQNVAGEMGLGLAVIVEQADEVAPKVGFDLAETAHLPLGGDESVDEAALFGRGGVNRW